VRPNEKRSLPFWQMKYRLSCPVHCHRRPHPQLSALSQDGITYLVSGGGGAKPYPIARTPDDLYQDPSFPNYHYVLFHFDGKQITAIMYRLADLKADKLVWETKDTFTIPMKP